MKIDFERILYRAKSAKAEIIIKGTYDDSKKEEEIIEVYGSSIKQSNRVEGDDLKTFAFKELRHLYNLELQRNFENLVVLTGAGASKEIGEGDKKGLLLSEFWKIIDEALNSKYGVENSLETICEKARFDLKGKGNDIEALLSRLFLLQQTDSKISVTFGSDPDSKKVSLADISEAIEKKIRDLCDLKLPIQSPQRNLLEKLAKRKQSDPRIKLFTLNYDTLFEQASGQINAVLIDGFSFNLPRIFSGRNFDYDIVKRENSKLGKDNNYLERVFHLYKLHGSINWERRKEDGEIFLKENTEEPLMIYPRGDKYEVSYEQPYFEMMSRFQSSLRQNNVTLIVIGYSFLDKHINTVIVEAFNQNPSFDLIIVDPYLSEDSSKSDLQKEFIRKAKKTSRIMLIGETFFNFADHFPENQTHDEREQTRIIYPAKSSPRNQKTEETAQYDEEDKPF